MQQGDYNASATYQTLMNHVFASYIGVFMYIYLDDIIIFLDSIKEHVEHIRTIFDILRCEQLFLGPNKMQFFTKELKILGHVIDKRGIRMDPHKVDKVLNWKTPMSGPLCHLVHSLQTVCYSTEDTLYLCLRPRVASCICCL